MGGIDLPALTARAHAELVARAVPADAAPMQAYMKTEMPFLGVKKKARTEVERILTRQYPPADATDYRDAVEALWVLPHREEKYLAIAYARAFPAYVTSSHLGLCERLVVEGAWWDFVDDIAAHLVGAIVRSDREAMRPVLEEWVDGDDMWLRRTAILCQLRHRDATDAAMLFDFCRRRAHEREFFIRKAIGWALREYARTDAEAVRAFLDHHGDELSGLSRREASRHL